MLDLIRILFAAIVDELRTEINIYIVYLIAKWRLRAGVG